jgi:heme/copper-type cytochrome/quinol oxidase subunit 1
MTIFIVLGVACMSAALKKMETEGRVYDSSQPAIVRRDNPNQGLLLFASVAFVVDALGTVCSLANDFNKAAEEKADTQEIPPDELVEEELAAPEVPQATANTQVEAPSTQIVPDYSNPATYSAPSPKPQPVSPPVPVEQTQVAAVSPPLPPPPTANNSQAGFTEDDLMAAMGLGDEAVWEP